METDQKTPGQVQATPSAQDAQKQAEALQISRLLEEARQIECRAAAKKRQP